MKPRQTTLPSAILDELKGNTTDERLLHRLHSVILSLQGISVRETARIYGDAPRSVAYWLKRFKASGVDGLREEARAGRPLKLSPSQMTSLQRVLIQYRKQSKPVNAVVICDYARKQFGIALTVRQSDRILKKLQAGVTT